MVASRLLHDYLHSLGVVIEKHEGDADRPAWQQVAGFIFLESPRPASNHQPGSFLQKTKFFANPLKFKRASLKVNPCEGQPSKDFILQPSRKLLPGEGQDMGRQGMGLFYAADQNPFPSSIFSRQSLELLEGFDVL